MVAFRGIEVDIRANGRNMATYEYSDNDKFDEVRVRKFYIEAVPYASFSIGITLNGEYSFGDCGGALVHYYLDSKQVGRTFLAQKAW